MGEFISDHREVRNVQIFRAPGFSGDSPNGIDADQFDEICTHIVVRRRDGHLVGCVRVLELASGQDINSSYASEFYDLRSLASFSGPFLELGRFFVPSGPDTADAIRLIWAMITVLVDKNRVRMLFGCTSFMGTDTARHRVAFGVLGARHLGPKCWQPGVKSGETVRMSAHAGRPDRGHIARVGLPPLMRSYLAMGGWVSDHGVIDHTLSTIHVFTALEVNRIPARRAARLRQLAA